MTRNAPRGADIVGRLIFHSTVSDSDCWEWQGHRSPNGYGRISVNKQLRYVHRVAYEATTGAIPPGHEIDHLCRNRACWNPDHLEPVTHQINVRRGNSPGAVNLRRTHCPAGHSYAEHEVIRDGRRRCRACLLEYLKAYHAKRRRETTAA